VKIANIVPGFGGTFYCGNCLRDSGFVKSLKAAGHEAVTVPVYLPLTAKECTTDREIPVFYGAVNIYLKQNFRLFRNMPAWLERFFNSAPLLKYAAKKAGSTRASGLEDMTISMLLGRDGNQKEELQQLTDYLKHHEKPDVVHLSNALLIGIAAQIREELGIPVVSSLQDEDVWIDPMDEINREKLWSLMSEKARDVDAFVAVSGYFAGVMKQNMNIPDEKLHIVHIGVEPGSYKINVPALSPPVIGYLSRLNHENGLEIVVDAFIRLKSDIRLKNAKLRLSGGMTGDDKSFVKKQIKKLKKSNFLQDVEFVDDFYGDALDNFFAGLSVLTVPVLKGEAFGLYQLEAMASGIPVVQPALGAFPEVVEVTGGGAIFHPNTPEALATKLAEVLSQPEKLKQMSFSGRKAIEEKFNNKILTENMVKIYEKVVAGKNLKASV
jgi:glycosyltransferase involved in cell wall biosynthesis